MVAALGPGASLCLQLYLVQTEAPAAGPSDSALQPPPRCSLLATVEVPSERLGSSGNGSASSGGQLLFLDGLQLEPAVAGAGAATALASATAALELRLWSYDEYVEQLQRDASAGTTGGQ